MSFPHISGWLLYSLDTISTKCLIFYIWYRNYFSWKIPVLAFVRFKRGRIEALRKKIVEHFMAIFGILNDIII